MRQSPKFESKAKNGVFSGSCLGAVWHSLSHLSLWIGGLGIVVGVGVDHRPAGHIGGVQLRWSLSDSRLEPL